MTKDELDILVIEELTALEAMKEKLDELDNELDRIERRARIEREIGRRLGLCQFSD